jgi:hypothetical protein
MRCLLCLPPQREQLGVIELTYKDAAEHLGHELLFRDHEPTLDDIAPGRLWNFDADGALLWLVSEAYRIRLALSL